MKKVFKYAVEIDDFFRLRLPKEAQILSFQQQREGLFLWALVDENNIPEMRRFRLAGSGHEITEDNIKYVGTVQYIDKHSIAPLVLHLFEILA